MLSRTVDAGTSQIPDRRHRRWRSVAGATTAALAVGGSLVALGGQAAEAASFTVTSIADSGPGSLRAAVATANTTPGANTITFAVPNPSTIILASGALVISDDLTINGPGSSALTITAPGDIIDVGNNAPLALSGLTLDNAGSNGILADGSGDLSLVGVAVTDSASAGIVFNSSERELTIAASTITGSDGTGVLSIAGIESLAIASSTISANGTGVDMAGVLGTTSVIDTTVNENVVNGVTLANTAEIVSIRRSTVSKNGGVGLALSSLDQALALDTNTISFNGASGVTIASTAADVLVQDSTIAGNGTDAEQAGVAFSGVNGTTEIRRSTFSGHLGSAVTSNGPEQLIIENSTFTTNATGGAMPPVIRSMNQTVSVENSTLSGNSTGGSTSSTISATGSTTVANAIITANGAQDDSPVSTTDPALDVTYSLLPSSGVDGAGGVGNVVGPDPQLGPLTLNGGRTPTLLPLTGSPAIDAGEPGVTFPPTDQRGAARVTDGIIDIGAVETGPATTVTVAGTTVAENAGAATVVVTRSAGSTGPIDVGISLVDGTATTPDDYGPPTPGVVSWADGEVGPKSLTIPIVNDSAVESTETFSVVLDTSSTFPGTTLGGPATVTITDDDAVVPPGTLAGPAFTSLVPARYVDTRVGKATFDGGFAGEGIRTAGSEYRVQIAGRGGNRVPVGAKAVVVNVTAIFAQQTGFVTVHPCVNPRPNASSVNYSAGVNVPNEIVAPLSASGEICLYTDQQIHMAVDVVGFVAGDSSTVPVTPKRYLDTRAVGATFDGGFQAQGIRTAGQVTKLRVTGRSADVPAGAAAVIVNVTAINATSTGYVTVWPCAGNPPNASSLNHVAGVNRANELVASVNADGDICLFTSERINLAVDVVGYLPTGSSFTAVGPARVLDTRDFGETVDGLDRRGGKRGAGQQIRLQVTGRGGVPAGATSVVVNVTAAAPEAVGFVTVHPCADPRPNASSLNHVPGVNGANELIASVDANGGICLYTDQRTHLIVDVVGYQN